MHQVTFGFTVTGALDDVQVFANGVPVMCYPIGGGKYAGGFNNAQIKDGSVLLIIFHLSGTNGTDYKIEYQFVDNGSNEQDPTKPSPVSGTITTNNEKQERIKFQA